MRRRILTIVFAALVAVAVPLGAAFSFERGTLVLPQPVLLEDTITFPHTRFVTGWPEQGTLALTGGLLLGLASLVRRSA